MKQSYQMILIVIASVVLVSTFVLTFDPAPDRSEAYNQAVSDMFEVPLPEPSVNATNLNLLMNGVIPFLYEDTMKGFVSDSLGNCNVTIMYDKEYEHRNIYHDWNMQFHNFTNCETENRLLILDEYSNAVESYLLILDPPVTRTPGHIEIINWEDESQKFYAEFDSDGDTMIEFNTFANGKQRIWVDEDESIPTKEILCLEFIIDITEDGSCLYQIALDRIEVLEEYHAVPGNPRASFGSGELIPEPEPGQVQNQDVQS